MNTAGAIQLGYANTAIGTALLDRLVARKIITLDDAKVILDAAEIEIQSLGSLACVPGTLEVIRDVRARLAKQGVS